MPPLRAAQSRAKRKTQQSKTRMAMGVGGLPTVGQSHLIPAGLDIGIANEVQEHMGWNGSGFQYFGEQIDLLTAK